MGETPVVANLGVRPYVLTRAARSMLLGGGLPHFANS